MKNLLFSLALLGSFAAGAQANTVISVGTSACNSNFSICDVFESTPLLLFPDGQLGISGDIILLDQWTGQVSDVFRVFNDFIDTGGGTGLGTYAILYSEDLGNLPDPSTYSDNAVQITENWASGGGQINTQYYSDSGTTYNIYSANDGAPEPSTFALMGLGAVGLVWRRRRRA